MTMTQGGDTTAMSGGKLRPKWYRFQLAADRKKERDRKKEEKLHRERFAD